MDRTYGMPMTMKWKSLTAGTGMLVAAMVTIPAADAGGRRDEQDVMPFSMIKRRVDAAVGGATYVGSEFNPSSNRYRLKYVKNGKVMWVDADGRTGDIIAMAR